MNNFYRVLLLLLLLPLGAMAAPFCSTIFTNPPTGNHLNDGFSPPDNILNNKIGDLECFRSSLWLFQSRCRVNNNLFTRPSNFNSGDYSYGHGVFKDGSELSTNGKTTRLYFDSLTLENAKLNLDGAAEDLFIYVAGSLQVAGLNEINAIVYVAGSVQIAGNAELTGAISAGGALDITENSIVNIDLNAVNQADLIGMCQSGFSESQCFSDNFNHSDLTQNWVRFKSSGDFTPSIVNNRLRLTEAVQDQATAATFQRIFPAKGNLVRVEFDYFAYDGTGADGVAIVFSDAEVTPQVGAFGGPLGYGYKKDEQQPGFAGGWLGIGLDEYGNYSVEGGGNSLDSRRRQSVVLRGSGAGYSGYDYLAGTCNNGTVNTNGNCLSTAIDDNNGTPLHRYRITIDSRQSDTSVVTVSRRVGISGDWEDLIEPIDVMTFQVQQNVPDELFMSITGSTGSVTNIHEIDEFEVCALNSRPVGEQINHFRITLPQQALTCDVAEVSVKACANDDCSSSFTEPVTANLKPNSLPGATGGWVNGSTLSFNNGIGQAQLRRNQAGHVEVGVLGSNPTAVAFNNTKCSYNGSDFSEANCVVEFVDSGFVLDVPHAYANQLVTGTITALSKGDNPELCIPSFAGVDKNVSLWSEYLIPSGGQGFSAMNVVVDGSAISDNSAAPSHRSLYFDQNGQAEFELTYREAGSLALHARFNGSGDEQDLLLEGQANFIRVPRALVLSANHTYNSAHPDGKCSAANLGCLVFARAGEGFNLNIKAVAAEPNEDNDFTNNLGLTNYQQPSIILNHTLVEPSNGSPGTIGAISYDHELGSFTTVQQSVHEVGVFDFSLVPPTSYLGLDLIDAGLPIAVAATGRIGRFIPAYFAVSPMTVSLAAACNSDEKAFTYLGQPFAYANNPGLYLQPKSGNGADTLNYLIGPWWRYDNQWADREYSNEINDLTIAFTNELPESVIRQSTSTSGVLLNHEQLSYQKPIEPMVPFNADFNLRLSINDLTDSDGVCYRADYFTPCLEYTFENIDQTMPLYWGRLTIEDVFGPETQDLQQTIISEYYTSAGFVTNSHDNCTELPVLSAFEFESDDFSVNQGGPTPPLVTVTIQPDTSPLTLEQGVRSLNYTAPGVSNRGVIKALLNLEQHGLPWLRRYNSQSENWDDSVAGQVQFGLYRGNDRVIWWREGN